MDDTLYISNYIVNSENRRLGDRLLVCEVHKIGEKLQAIGPFKVERRIYKFIYHMIKNLKYLKQKKS